MEHISDASFFGKLLVLQANGRLDSKVIVTNTNLFGLVVSDKGKKFYSIDSRSFSK